MVGTYLQDLIKLDEISQDDVAMGLEHGERDKKYHPVRVVVRPQNLPQTQDILKRKLALE